MAVGMVEAAREEEATVGVRAVETVEVATAAVATVEAEAVAMVAGALALAVETAEVAKVVVATVEEKVVVMEAVATRCMPSQGVDVPFASRAAARSLFDSSTLGGRARQDGEVGRGANPLEAWRRAE